MCFQIVQPWITSHKLRFHDKAYTRANIHLSIYLSNKHPSNREIVSVLLLWHSSVSAFSWKLTFPDTLAWDSGLNIGDSNTGPNSAERFVNGVLTNNRVVEGWWWYIFTESVFSDPDECSSNRCCDKRNDFHVLHEKYGKENMATFGGAIYECLSSSLRDGICSYANSGLLEKT